VFPKMGKKLHHGSEPPSMGDSSFPQAIATALQKELGLTHRAIKTVMVWTGASERTVKHWFAGTHGPNGQYLIDLARYSDVVLDYLLAASDRSVMRPGVEILNIRARLLDLIELIDATIPNEDRRK
jgi:hypothetical protein